MIFMVAGSPWFTDGKNRVWQEWALLETGLWEILMLLGFAYAQPNLHGLRGAFVDDIELKQGKKNVKSSHKKSLKVRSGAEKVI